MMSNGKTNVLVLGSLTIAFVLAVVAPLEADWIPDGHLSIMLTSDDLGLGSAGVNRTGNGSAVEADRPGKLVTSLDANVGSVLTIQTDGLAGSDSLLVTVTARTYMDVKNNLPAGYDFQGGVITLTKKDANIWKNGLGVRAFGIDLREEIPSDPDPIPNPNYGKRYVNTGYTGTNTHGFQMEGSGEVSGGKEVPDDENDDAADWAYFVKEHPEEPGNNPPHVDEDVTFDFNDSDVDVLAKSIKVLLTKIKAGAGPLDLGLILKITLDDGTMIVDEDYRRLSEAPAGIFSIPAGSSDSVLINFDAVSLGIADADLIGSFIIGARDDFADPPEGTDEHFLINGLSYTPEPATVSVLVLGGMAILARRRRRA